MKFHVKWHRLALALCLFSLVFSLANLPCFGQAAAINGQIEGTITDPQGATVPNAKVEVVNAGTDFSRSMVTDQTGFYRFTLLPLGEYEVTVSAPSFATVKRSGIVVNPGTAATVNIQLALGQVSREIVVTGDAPVVEPGRTDIGYTLGSSLITNLPLVSRNNFNFILQQPMIGGYPNTEFGVPRKINANGFNDRINYELDGSNNTESDRSGIRLMPISDTFIAEVEQVSNGFAPEFGNTVGTQFNAVTKSGTNDFHGEIAYLFRRTSFVANPSLQQAGTAKPIINLDDGFVNGGGRIIKDKLFFFASFEKIKRDLPSPVTVPLSTITALGLSPSLAQAIPFSQNVTFVLGKADWQINSANRLSFRYSYFRNEEPYDEGSFNQTLATQSFYFHDRAPAYAAQLISTVSPRAVNEFRFQFPKRDELQAPFSGTAPQPALVVSAPATVNFGGSTQVGFHFIEKTPELSDNFSYNVRTHSLKFGGDVRMIRDDNINQLFAQYTFGTVADYLAAVNGTNPKSYSNFQQILGNPEVKYNSVFTGLYVQDDWKARPNLTVIYGLRYDLYSMPAANSASLFSASQKFNTDTNNFAPRLGLAWAMDKSQKTVFRVNGGIFYDAPQTDLYRLALLNNGQPQFFTLNTGPTTAFAPSFPTVLTSVPTGFNLPLQDITTISPTFANLYSVNANAQISRQLAPNLGLTVGYLYTKGTKIPVYRNINLIQNGNFLADGRPIFSNARINPNFNNIVMAESVGDSEYNALNVTLTRRFAKGLTMFGSYTWSHAIDDAPEQNVIDSSNLFPEDPTNRRRDRGNSLSDRRHVFTANGSWQPSFTTNSKVLSYLVNQNRLNLMFFGGSGFVFDEGSNQNLNNDPRISTSLQRPLFIGRNTLRGPYIAQLDMRYSRLFPVGDRWKPEFFAEFTNLFNHTNVIGINANATVDAQGNIVAPPNLGYTQSLDQRLMQLGLKLSF